MNDLLFCGDSRKVLLSFPEAARRRAGRQLLRVQRGEEPLDWKPVPSIGTGVREIRIQVDEGAFRILYVTKVANRVYVLHCFQKKTQQTRQADIDLAAERFRSLRRDAGE